MKFCIGNNAFYGNSINLEVDFFILLTKYFYIICYLLGLLFVIMNVG